MSRPLFERDDTVRRAVIVVHGASRDAERYYNAVVDSATQAGADGHTIVLAPQFITQEDVAAFGLADNFEYWTGSGWKFGAAAQNGFNNTSFDWLDLIVTTLVDVHPNLEHIVVAGFSAGGMLTNRYSASTWLDIYAANSQVSMSFVVGAPSSYLWMDGTRPIADDSCDEYNEYPYGLEDLGDWQYVARLDPSSMQQSLARRSVYYFVGDQDNSTTVDNLDTGCHASRQGAHRLERAQNYNQHLTGFFGFAPPLAILPGVGHNPVTAFNTDPVRSWLFTETWYDR